MKTTIELPEDVLQRAKITAIQRKTTLKELIHQSLLRELDEPAQAKPDPNGLAEAFSHGSNTDAPVGRLRREELHDRQRPPTQTPLEGELPYYRHPITGFLVSRSLNTPGFVPPTLEESQAMIERANEEEDLCRAGLLR
ncbi:hypothetical protein HQ447_00530 [bacterium]|nr:hypothetical protein [bacterium]